MLKNTKKTHFNILDIKKSLITEHFTKTVVLLYSNKLLRNGKINLTEGNEVVSTDSELNRAFPTIFSKSVKEIKIPSISNDTHNESNDSRKEAPSYFKNRLCIVNIKRKTFQKF